mmetsp:Transcript_2150/g.3665  ORF Transcript_2150/g.3665 Transcript_2150/m.3665 type:complete len:426 (-) Transcript_2150:553-1830(-)|eukprot:CAMPEP_0198202222 /NCGR_PEP_ID=MMETSP1445-20131203/5335_1 /TAXON_ID=36898 /ORGANISM="Pyramimonas sp., Strain CCMP2087" /LENGTH=425 /DNA_ID=CAMNT_0043873025 /DNA_START=245 /DNA_END=1522 /DNA_ORIENTATION=-
MSVRSIPDDSGTHATSLRFSAQAPKGGGKLKFVVEDDRQIAVKISGIVKDVQARLRFPGPRRREIQPPAPTKVFVFEDTPARKGRKRFLLFGRRRTVAATGSTLALSTSAAHMPVPAQIGVQKSQTSSNAFAGACAGVMVSLSLHPIDTLKVIMQAESRSIAHLPSIMSKFIANRGLSGLYGGILPNLASSAPISAIYTTAYEGAKERLLPNLPEDRKWLAHVVAGGLASVATSFVYTPSECIKQRMQVTAHKSTWLALQTILRQDGPLGLYRGWTAVLCRNIPHSAFKFFTFEQMKASVVKRNDDRPMSTMQTLVVGGISGSTAALFTTPFDVVKTRLQTQAALNSAVQYKGVIDALTRIMAVEGLGGLYRGIVPRVVIYISQGAIFFASYEFMKQAMDRKQALHASMGTSVESSRQFTPAPTR